ncbi:MAG TPA: DUF2007 domain-containing protein [Acidimicrobiia bacterium]|nr:DUF2007 domain-containing protein [Acidimicrobiia bacterium]
MAPDRLVPVAEAPDPGSAHIYAALLMSSGIPVRLHGEAMGPYAVTVGRWAVTTLWVPESDRDDAVELLEAEDLDPAVTIIPPRDPSPPWPRRLVATTVLGAVAVGIVIWLLAAL